MFPIAHVWLVERIVPDPTPAHRLGSVWPDMLFGSPLSHPDTHRRGEQLLAFARARLDADAPAAAEFLAFVAGAISHGSVPHGFDWYSDEHYGNDPNARGYAFQHGAPLAADTAAACHLPAELGLWKAHNIVEMACERDLYAADPGLSDRFAAACADNGLVERVAQSLAEFFDRPVPALADAIRTFAKWWTPPTSAQEQARVYARQVEAKHGVPDADVPRLASLILRAEQLIAGDREAYLATCVARVGALLDELSIR
jgi:hypothetical protein